MAKLVLVHWDEEEAIAWAEALTALGWDVSAQWTDGSDAYRVVREWQPDVVAVSLERKPGHGVQVAESVRRSRWGQDVPFIFVAGEDEDALMTLRDGFPEATYVEREELAAAIRPFREE